MGVKICRFEANAHAYILDTPGLTMSLPVIFSGKMDNGLEPSHLTLSALLARTL